jgi:hypothetical protein
MGDDDDRALGDELPGDALPLEALGVRVPGHGLLLLGLAEALEQANTTPVGVERIDIVDDIELVAVAVELDVYAERGGVALDPVRPAVQGRPRRAALGQAAGADEDPQVEVARGE